MALSADAGEPVAGGAGDPVALAIVFDGPAARAVAGRLFPDRPQVALGRADLRPALPFSGPLFAALAGVATASCVGLVVPVIWRGAAGAAAPDSVRLVAVGDHINLELRGPLTGLWPAGVPRTFPPLTGIYQPAIVRTLGGPQVYSAEAVVAGVADAARLSPFEAGAIRRQGCDGVADMMVPSVIVAAYYGLKIAACGVLQAPHIDEE